MKTLRNSKIVAQFCQNWNRRKPRASKTLGLNCSVLQFKEFRFQCFAKWKHFEIRNFTKKARHRFRPELPSFALLCFASFKKHKKQKHFCYLILLREKKTIFSLKAGIQSGGKWRKTLELSKAMNLDSENPSRKQFSLSFLFLFFVFVCFEKRNFVVCANSRELWWEYYWVFVFLSEP